MSRGLGVLQKTILGILDGTEKALVYKNSGGGLITRELVEELIERELLNERAPRKQLASSVIRACGSLCQRGLLEGTYNTDADNPGRYTITWRTAQQQPKPK